MAERKLTDRQKVFCRLCAEGMKPIEAAKKAGYQNVYRTTGDMLRNERIRKEIERQKGKKESSVKMEEEAPVAEKEEILTFLTGMMREDDDPKLRMKAAELLGKRESLFERGKAVEDRCCVVIVDDLP